MRPVIYILIFFILLLIYILSIIFIIKYLKLPKNWPIYFLLVKSSENNEDNENIDIYINNKFYKTISIPDIGSQIVYISSNIILNGKPLKRNDLQSISFFIAKPSNIKFIAYNLPNKLYYVPEPDFKNDKNGEIVNSFTIPGYYTIYF